MLKLHVEVEGDIRSVGFVALREGAGVIFVDHVRGSPDFFLGFLGPYLLPQFLFFLG